MLQKAIIEIVRELLEQSKTKLQPSRKNEIENHLTISIRQIAKFIDHGGDVEVVPGLPEVPPEPEPPAAESPETTENAAAQDAYLKAKQMYDSLATADVLARDLLKKGAGVGSLPPRPQPILQLGDGPEGEVEKKV